MREEYDIEMLHQRKNPYVSMLNRQITSSIDPSAADCPEALSETDERPPVPAEFFQPCGQK